ncbi:hypothetical protein AAU57_07980 [Nonlabens sp. YIK11]|uniref:hypothetical protein n=1 Tax=Nonlabens sp. YIK11 TaxID=1453349 RepID=UPI0006DD1424|nr:hypothetical protein [Nonlabens sp. YIK11]KQC33260.1 hypothetical protein AAU57_07980 [Nonlabens sp. YIK11]
MKIKLLSIFALIAILTSCDIKKTDGGELPEVDVDVEAEAGELPEYDVDWMDVDVTTTTRTVEVPKLVVVMEEEQVEVPVLDVDMPGDKMERTLTVEAEIAGTDQDLEIQEVRATNNKLYVISTLEDNGTDLEGKTIRRQDQVVLNAPSLDVEYIIVGEKPNRIFNNNNRYFADMSSLDDDIANAKVIYNK